MDALGLGISLRSAGSGILLNTCAQQNVRKFDHNSARGTTFRGQGLTPRKRIGYSETKRPSSTKRVFASAGSETQSVESNASKSEGNGHGSNQAVLEKPNAPEEQQAEEGSKFNWATAWYPIAVINDLDKNGPTAATIIGRPLALWWDRSTDKWQVYADQCPHRLAPLSEGSISAEGHLRCSYHGWTFKGDSGECTGIPQAPKEGKPLHESKKACVTVYPSMEHQGILWFWPDLSQGSINVEAAANPPPHIPEFGDPAFGFDLSSRDLEYGYETLIENLMDPAHVNFAHHKIQGNRKNATDLKFQITSKITPAGFSGKDENSEAIFNPPCCFRLAFTIGGKKPVGVSDVTSGRKWSLTGSSKEKAPKKVSLIFICIPVSPGRSRLIWSFPRNFFTTGFKIIPPWVTHMTNNLVLDSDLLLLHLLGKRLEYEGESNWFERCYTPAGADAYVIGFRKWLNDFAGGAPDWAGRFENKIPPSPPKEIILDRYYTHVVRCKSCSSACKNFKALEVTLQVLAIALVGLVAASAVLPIPAVTKLAVPMVIGAVLSTILSRWLANFIYKTFYFHDYNHAVVTD
ncbi:hypothetical protein M758_6G152500 [Ceratodon purpureus]|nr:hypothetical protein M758_6G152500 [Ceratodon purpureus]KAG0614123.1 hypothetical protein M758_6G152500 [Ceratodon purpureus]KAG0614124.1 hypothetical protein M758_6G152500 [Ceratodon purpureus]KAG0614126.1 hypothetical protein M758_6G152500 [Ceratodon purpureus]KAG0614127.1 hypothetical protein M758_6G152500 [Ceratodon purpureus]